MFHITTLRYVIVISLHGMTPSIFRFQHKSEELNRQCRADVSEQANQVSFNRRGGRGGGRGGHNGQGARTTKLTCFLCDEEGHIMKNC